MSVLDRVREQYPTLAFLLNDREIGPLLRKATDPNQPFSPQRFQQELMQTNWFQSRSVAARNYTIQRNTDPGEFRQNISNYEYAVRAEAKRLGVSLTGNEVKYLAHSAARNGYDTGDPRIAQGISSIRKRNPSRVQYGAIRTSASEARAIAHRDFMIPLRDNDMWRWADNIARGHRTEGDFRNWAKNQAIKRYGHLRNQLNAGYTMNDLFGGHIQTVAETLELNPEDIQPWRSGSKWAPMLGVTDRKNGRTRAMTQAEVQRLARLDERYWGTAEGRQADAGMTQFMLQTFGKRA